ncbi:thermonuclease family protein [Rhizobium sp. ZPR3]|uniref:Thermonuclease family protein n=2 Tax=unclassified Rhizobium TaxID=2613769 RepID=A0AAU7SS72_9HYPH
MLDEIEITLFRNRIDDILRNGQPTRWQRQFLYDMQQKFVHYGVRTRLTEKQLSMLRRLTDPPSTSVVQLAQRRPPSPIATQRKSQRRSYGYRSLQVKAVLFLVLLMAVLVNSVFYGGISFLWPSSGSEHTSIELTSQFAIQSFSITDGDTIRMDDGTRVRLVGFNAPEVFHPRCSREAVLGNKATERVKQLVASGSSTVTKVECSCKPGTEGTDRCNYGRSCGILKVDGKEVGQTLIAEGLAVSFVCGRTGCPSTPSPWCG